MGKIICLFLVLGFAVGGCSFAQEKTSDIDADGFNNIYAKFLRSPISDTSESYNQIIDELNKILNRQDLASVTKAKTSILIILSYIFQNNFLSAFNEIVKAIPLMEKSVPQGQNSSVFSTTKSAIEKGTIKNYAVLSSMPEFNENAKQIAERLNLLIEGRENYRKSVEQCA